MNIVSKAQNIPLDHLGNSEQPKSLVQNSSDASAYSGSNETQFKTMPTNTTVKNLAVIQELLKEVLEEVRFPDPSTITLRVVQGLIGPGSPAAMCGQVLIFSDDSLMEYESLDEVERRDYDEWNNLLNEIPETPNEIGRYLDNCSKVALERIDTLSKKFVSKCSPDEAAAILSHELGHNKHHHAHRRSQRINLLASLAFVSAAFSTVSLIRYLGHSMRLPVVLFEFLTILTALTYAGNAIQRTHEVEADGECANSERYRRGLVSYHKKWLLFTLLGKATSNFENKVEQMLQQWDLFQQHPNSAKRLQYATELSVQPEHSKTMPNTGSWAVAELWQAARKLIGS